MIFINYSVQKRVLRIQNALPVFHNWHMAIYIYSTILIKPNSILCNLTSKDLDALYLMFKTQYRSKGTYQWPSDLTK